MSEETGATAQAVPAEPTGATESATPQAQPSAEQATPAEPQINWDDQRNPYLQKFNGREGAHKQQVEENRRLREQMNGLQQQMLAYQEEQRQATARANQQQLQEMLDGDPEELQRSLKERLQHQKAVEEWQATMVPQYERQARDAAGRLYTQFIHDTAQDWGLSPADVQAISQQHGNDYVAFRKAMVGKVREKHVAEATQGVDERIKAATEALRIEFLGQQRAAEKSPDTGGSAPPKANDDQLFLREYSQGRSSDHRRAREVLAKL